MGLYAIAAIGYKRTDSMQRLLNFLAKADYDNDDVTLIVSIDNSGEDSVEVCARNFDWRYGKKEIITYPERQGLRRHILHCGNFLKDFEAIAVFEDDIIPAPGFYHYMKEAVAFYKDDARIAGISLYTHLWNENANLPFQPAYGVHDNYFMQFAQSWGQIWMKKQWFEFSNWYINNCGEMQDDDEIPQVVLEWPGTSWLKYHIKYCIKNNKYFVYPYGSLSTCFSEAGEHCKEKSTIFQVPLQEGLKKNYRFCSLDEDGAVVYDAFFERNIINSLEGICAKDICMDLYGYRKSYLGKKYVLTTRTLPYEVIKSYGLELRPIEENVLQKIAGDFIYLYNTEISSSTAACKDSELFRYWMRLNGKTRMLAKLVIKAIRNRLGS